MVEIATFSSFSQGFPAAWQQFVEATAATFDQTLPWYVEFERRLLEPAQRLQIVAAAAADGTPLALLPLRTDRVPLAGPIAASGVTALSNYYTALYAPLALPGRDQELAHALVQGIIDLSADTSVIDLNPLAGDAALTDAVAADLRQRGYSIERYFRFGNWYLEVGERSSSEYFKTLPGQVRSTLERKGKKLRARPDVRIRVVTDAAEVDAAMDAYEAVYRSSWKTDEPHKDFIRAIVKEFAQRNWLRLGVTEIGSVPAAAQIWFVYRGTASIFKLAYDAQFTNLSVGSAMTMTLMQHVIDADKVAVVDYLCGDDPYKRDWMSARRERIGLRAVRRASWPGAVTALKSVARRIRGPRPNTSQS